MIRLTALRAPNPIVRQEETSRDAEEREHVRWQWEFSRRGQKEFKPRLIFWEVTKGCNLRCIHCRATATELMSPQDLPTAKALDIIRQIANFGNPILVLSGGEPLYRPDIFRVGRIR